MSWSIGTKVKISLASCAFISSLVVFTPVWSIEWLNCITIWLRHQVLKTCPLVCSTKKLSSNFHRSTHRKSSLGVLRSQTFATETFRLLFVFPTNVPGSAVPVVQLTVSVLPVKKLLATVIVRIGFRTLVWFVHWCVRIKLHWSVHLLLFEICNTGGVLPLGPEHSSFCKQ